MAVMLTIAVVTFSFGFLRSLYDLWKLSVFKCNIFKVYLKYTCNSSALTQSNLLQYIFSWTSALLPHK